MTCQIRPRERNRHSMTQQQCQSCTELRSRLMVLRAEVAATSALIRAELEEPTMPWAKLLRHAAARLDSAVSGG